VYFILTDVLLLQNISYLKKKNTWKRSRNWNGKYWK